MPFFSSKVLGDLLLDYAMRYPDIHFEVYCGHTHTAHDYRAHDNLLVRVGGAEYSHPKIADMIQL